MISMVTKKWLSRDQWLQRRGRVDINGYKEMVEKRSMVYKEVGEGHQGSTKKWERGHQSSVCKMRGHISRHHTNTNYSRNQYSKR